MLSLLVRRVSDAAHVPPPLHHHRLFHLSALSARERYLLVGVIIGLAAALSSHEDTEIHRQYAGARGRRKMYRRHAASHADTKHDRHYRETANFKTKKKTPELKHTGKAARLDPPVTR